MVVFKKGELLWGDLLGILYCESLDEGKDWWDYPLRPNAITLEIKDKKTIRIYSQAIPFIPREIDYEDINYDVFWESEETIVFECVDYLINYIENYEGEFKVELLGCYNSIKDTIEFNNLRDIW